MRNIIIRNARRSDIGLFKDRICESDRVEIMSSHGHTPESALIYSIEKTIYCKVAENGEPICIFGINPDSLLGEKAIVWMLSTDKLKEAKIKFFRESKKYITELLEWYPLLYNYVDARNTKSIQWLRWLGAVIEEAKPFGLEGKQFHYFYFKRK